MDDSMRSSTGLSVTPHCLLLGEDTAPPLKSNIFFTAELGVKGGEGEVAGAADTTESGDIDLPSPVEERDLPDMSSAESHGGSNGRLDTGGVYGGESSKGAKGMSLLRKLIPRVPVDSSFTSEGSLVVGGVGELLFSSLSLDSRMFSELESLLTQACMEESSGEETGVSRLPSSKTKVLLTLASRFI